MRVIAPGASVRVLDAFWAHVVAVVVYDHHEEYVVAWADESGRREETVQAYEITSASGERTVGFVIGEDR